MIKTRIQVLEEIYDKTLLVVMASEIDIEYYKKYDPKKVIIPQKEVVRAGIRTKQDFTAEMLIKLEELKTEENNIVLSIIDKKIKAENE